MPLVPHDTWRPDWETGRPRYCWYLSFEHQTHLAEVIARLQRRLGRVDAAEPVPIQWLHLTVQDIGFADDVGGDVSVLTDAAAERLRDLPALRLRLGPVTAMRSAVALAAEPVGDLETLRSRLRDATSSARPPSAGPGPAVFRPHVSLAYLKRGCDPAVLLDPLGQERTTTLDASVSAVTLAEVTRGHCSYRWQTCAEIPLGRR